MAEDNVSTSNMELVFDVISESIEFLFDKVKGDYFTLYALTVKNILASEILNEELNKEDKESLSKIYSKLTDKDISTEDIRKAIQSLMLRGFQEVKVSNGEMTPDTIGLLFAYFISKFDQNPRDIKILDPLSGVGNLLFTLDNHLAMNTELFAIEHNKTMVNILKLNSELMSTNVNIYFQNTLSSSLKDMDYVVIDFDYYDQLEDKTYFPYKTILHHISSLKDNGIMLCCIPDDFFNYDSNQEFKKTLSSNSSIIGLIELPNEMFKKSKKSILIIKKEVLKDKKCLMVKLPSFSDPKEVNNALTRIEMWFEENINNNKSEEM